jgi:LacI family transcriptional regulator
MAVEHLIRYGRRRIATITGPLTMSAGQDRLAGYRSALRDAGIRPDEQMITEGDFTQSGGYIAAQKLLPKQPDAIFVASDLMATGALRALREAGQRVPDDTAIVGFDDTQIAAYSDPPLTTIRQPVFQLGTVAAETLLHLIENNSNGPLRTILPTELVIRSSCGAKTIS